MTSKRTNSEPYKSNETDQSDQLHDQSASSNTEAETDPQSITENSWSEMDKYVRHTAAERLHEKAMAAKSTEPVIATSDQNIEPIVEKQHLDANSKIKALNDKLRKTGEGGVIVMTQGVMALESSALTQCLKLVQEQDHFDEDNDPYGEHDLGVVKYGKTKLIWKIDYYDLDMMNFSPDPTDENVTKRVLTIMLISEY